MLSVSENVWHSASDGHDLEVVGELDIGYSINFSSKNWQFFTTVDSLQCTIYLILHTHWRLFKENRFKRPACRKWNPVRVAGGVTLR